MTVLDRKNAPVTKTIEDIQFVKIEKTELKNGIPLHIINAGTQDVVKIELIFEAGHWNCENQLVAEFTNRMLIEGSSNYSSFEIAEKFDYLGTFISFECGKHFASIQLYCLSNFFEKSIEILESFVKHPVFPEKEFVVQLKKEYQQFVLNKEKTEIIAAEEFYKILYGEKHPYGKLRKNEDFENLSVEQLKAHHKRYYNPVNCKIIIAGKLNDEMIKLVDSHFGGLDWQQGEKTDNQSVEEVSNLPGRYQIIKDNAAQASIRIGCKSISRQHDDFQGLSILNTVLGGYFGSRLMTNLREKNALTYGIYSSVIPLLKGGVFSIVANVNNNLTNKAIEQIKKEIDIIRNELINEDELNMVKNFITGEMLKAFDGPLLVADLYAGLLNYGLDFSYYDIYLNTLKSITSGELKNLANKYLDPKNFIEITVGNF